MPLSQAKAGVVQGHVFGECVSFQKRRNSSYSQAGSAASADQQAQASGYQHGPCWLAVNLMLRLNFIFFLLRISSWGKALLPPIFLSQGILLQLNPSTDKLHSWVHIVSLPFRSSKAVQISKKLYVSLYSAFQQGTAKAWWTLNLKLHINLCICFCQMRKWKLETAAFL